MMWLSLNKTTDSQPLDSANKHTSHDTILVEVMALDTTIREKDTTRGANRLLIMVHKVPKWPLCLNILGWVPSLMGHGKMNQTLPCRGAVRHKCQAS